MIVLPTIRTRLAAFAVLLSAGCPLLAAQAEATEPFTVELGAAYHHAELTSSSQIFFGLNPLERRPFRIIDEDDAARLSATWYYNEASSDDGPLSRAGFTSRASSLSLSVANSNGGNRSEVDGPPVVVAPDPPIIITPPLPPPISIPGEPAIPPLLANPPSMDSTQVSFDGRHVFESTGWYLFGSAVYEDSDVKEIGFDGSGESTRLLAGFGKYVGKTTSLDLAVLNVDNELRLGSIEFDDSSTEWLLGLTHIADLTGSWQYGLDLAVSTMERFGNDGSLSLRGSLYPNRFIAVGFDILTSVESALDEGTRYGAFASWFITPRFEVFAEASTIEPLSTPGLKVEEDSYGVGIRLRL